MAAPKMKSKNRRAQIAQAALTLVSTQGVAAMTIERTARMVGLAPSAIYRHFKNKAEVIDAVLDLLQEQFINELEELKDSASDPMDVLHQLLMQRVRHIMEHKSIPKLFFSEEINYRFPEQKQKIHKLLNTFIQMLTDIVAQGQDQGQIRTDVTAQQAAVMFIGLFKPVDDIYELSGGAFDLVSHMHKVWVVFSDAISLKSPKGE